MQVKLKIDERFASLCVLEILNYFHLGKEKQKSLKVFLDDKEIGLNYYVKIGDILVFSYLDQIDYLPLNLPLKILYEDENLLIVDKPKGMLVHPDDKSKNGTLVNVISNYYHQTHQNIGVRYLHRIDTDTTGIVMFAKDILTAARLNYEIANNELHRIYLCIASGNFKDEEGTFDFPIAEDRHIANKKRVSKTGKKAITHYQVVERLSNNLNIVTAKLETGRTHQIRLHFSYSGHPLVGDALYNGNTNLLNRQALHSYQVFFIQPFTNQKISIISDIPNDLLKIWRKYHKKI